MPKLTKRDTLRKYKEGFAYIPIGNKEENGYAKCSLEDAGILEQYYWGLDGNGYAVSNTGLKRGENKVYMHQLVLRRKRKGYFADHINHDILDNRRENLRLISIANSQKNRRAHNTENRTSKYKGVCKVKNWKEPRWQWAVYDHRLPTGRVYGYTFTELEAAYMYNKHAKKLHGKYAVLNKIEETIDF